MSDHTGSYKNIGVFRSSPALGTGQHRTAGVNEVHIVGSEIVLSATLSASDGSTDIEVVSLSASQFNNSASFSGADYTTVFGPRDVSNYSNIAITLINNGPGNIQSASIEFSPNNSQWEEWSKTLSGLTASGVDSLQIAGNSRKWLRVRAIASGANGDLTSSLDTYVDVNLG